MIIIVWYYRITYFIIAENINYFNWNRKKHSIKDDVIVRVNEDRTKRTTFFFCLQAYNGQSALSVLMTFENLYLPTSQNSVFTYNNHKDYTITLTVASIKDFRLVYFNAINHSIRDVQHTSNHLPRRTKLMRNEENIIAWRDTSPKKGTFIYTCIKREITIKRRARNNAGAVKVMSKARAILPCPEFLQIIQFSPLSKLDSLRYN